VRRNISKNTLCHKINVKIIEIFNFAEPSNSDAIKHMIRLRSALGWRTMLPRHGPGVRQAMRNTNHKNPLQVEFYSFAINGFDNSTSAEKDKLPTRPLSGRGKGC